MAVFSPKAKQIINAAIADVSVPEYKEVWTSWVASHPDTRKPGEPWQGATDRLQYEVVVAALWALEEMKRRLRGQLEGASLSEDEASDIDNRLSHIISVERFLVQGAP